MKKNHFSNQEGNILIESIVSISLILIGLLGIFSLLSSSMRDNKNAYLKTTASYLAAEGIEVVKNIVDTDVATPDTPWGTILEGEATMTFEVAYDADKATMIRINGSSTRPLVIDTSTNLFRYGTNGENEDITPFFRTVTLKQEETNPNELLVSSVVEWTDRGAPKKVFLETIFANWRSN